MNSVDYTNKKNEGIIIEDVDNNRTFVVFLNKETNHWEYEGYSDVNGLLKGEIPDEIMLKCIDNKLELNLYLHKLD